MQFQQQPQLQQIYPVAAAQQQQGFPVVYVAAANDMNQVGVSRRCIKVADGFRRPNSTPQRIIIDFYPAGAYSGSESPFESEYSQGVPEMLQMRGVTAQEWELWLAKLQTDVQGKQVACGAWGYSTGLQFVWLLIPAVLVIVQFARYQRALKAWLDGLNQTVLLPKGMFAATQTEEITVTDDQGRMRTECISWLAIATTPEEISLLQSEAHIWMFNRGCPLPCFGPTEDTVTPASDWNQSLCCLCCEVPLLVDINH